MGMVTETCKWGFCSIKPGRQAFSASGWLGLAWQRKWDSNSALVVSWRRPGMPLHGARVELARGDEGLAGAHGVGRRVLLGVCLHGDEATDCCQGIGTPSESDWGT